MKLTLLPRAGHGDGALEAVGPFRVHGARGQGGGVLPRPERSNDASRREAPDGQVRLLL